ncbi:ABC-type multidrug transport system, ATPase and permease component [Pseudomonas asturiensis]|uniref:ABC-type multidrug transport system, ATPase and permease component n=1 Tax=Pseudomonas asturiensis TaxID=1190415 RepID=A0A1M7JUM7_9PSED|nr:ABC transporter ATP-binding protein [Pseudomonas asturiensis]SHM56684.1 ABC-type multidrug transport system, ATPase and permease component [Pseudomonas asturiensis]
MSVSQPFSLLRIPSRALSFVRGCGATRASITSMLSILAGKAGLDAISALLLAAVLTVILPVNRAAGGWYAQIEAFVEGPFTGVVSPLLVLVALLVLCKGLLIPLLLGLRGRLMDQWTLLVSMQVLTQELLPQARYRPQAHAQGSNVAVNFVVPRIVAGVILPSLDVLTEIALVSLLLCALLVIEPFASSVLILALLGIAYLGNLLSRKLVDRQQDQKFKLNTLMQRWVTDSVGCVREIRLYRRMPAVLDRYRSLARRFARDSARERTFMDVQAPVMELTFLLILGASVLVITERSWQADFHLLALFSAVGMRLILGLRRILTSLQVIRFSRPALEHMTADRPVNVEKVIRASSQRECETEELLVCESLYYAHPGADQDIIRRLNLCLRKGEWVGLVGQSGVGKSTLVDLLIGELEPREGHIHWRSVGGRRSGIGYAGAVTTLIPGTLRDNVAFLGQACTDSKVMEALGFAQIALLVERLPEGLDTAVEFFEQNISSGERQRIGLARALLHATSLLILDEATASLDQSTERDFLEQVRAARPDLAVLLITHRLSALHYTERNLLMTNGTLDVFTPDRQSDQVAGFTG